ncbi:MAG: hypothetical protein WBD06_21095, partial [Acidobacteriaceae bacterium]
MPIRITPTEPLDPLVEDFADESESQESPDSRPPGSPSEGPNSSGLRRPLLRSRYEGLDHTDLLHVIDELEGSRSWGSLREKLWIALIIHMLVAWYLLYGPKYIYHVRVVDPSVIMKQRAKDLTFLDLPPDALKKVKPKSTNIISDKDRIAQSQHPTLDRKTLQELEAMRRAGPPAPTQAPPAQT